MSSQVSIWSSKQLSIIVQEGPILKSEIMVKSNGECLQTSQYPKIFHPK